MMRPLCEADLANIAKTVSTERGIDIAAERLPSIIAQLAESVRYDPDDNALIVLNSNGDPALTFEGGAVRAVCALDHIAKLAGQESKPSRVNGDDGRFSGLTAAMLAKRKSDAEDVQASRKSRAADLALQWGNPWQTNNLTHQGVIKNLDPDLAARLSGSKN